METKGAVTLAGLFGALWWFSNRQQSRNPARQEVLGALQTNRATILQRLNDAERRRADARTRIQTSWYQAHGRLPTILPADDEHMRASEAIKRLRQQLRMLDDEITSEKYRNPTRGRRSGVVKAGAIDKAEEKVRKLADAARGSMASPQSKAAYRRALDELMQLRIDAGTQGTLFDVAPRQTTQRGLPGLFDNPPSWEDYARWRELAAKVEAAIKDDMAELPDPGTYKRKPTALELMGAGGKKMSDVPKWTVAQVEAKRKSIIAAGMKRFKITGEDDTWRVREHLDTTFRPKYPRY